MTRTPLALLLALAGSNLPAGARAQDAADPGVTDAVSAGLEVDVPSRYVARGVAASEGPTLQPSAWVGYAGLTVPPNRLDPATPLNLFVIGSTYAEAIWT
jgi:hypothetical protein